MQTVSIKVVVFGGSVGKTSLLNACVCTSESDYETYKPFEHVSTMTVEMKDSDSDVVYKLELWDNRSVESHLRVEEMRNCAFSVALICYSVMEIQSFEEVRKKWLPFVRKNSPQSHIMLIGTKVDLRDDRVSLLRLDRLQNLSPISMHEGYKFAVDNNAIFHECSAFSRFGIDDLFHKIIKMQKFPTEEVKKCSCIIA